MLLSRLDLGLCRAVLGVTKSRMDNQWWLIDSWLLLKLTEKLAGDFSQQRRSLLHYITPLIWLGSARVLARLMFIQHLLSLPFVQRKEVTFRWLQQFRAGTRPVPASQLVLGSPGSASCMHGFLPEGLQMGSLTPYFLSWWLKEESLNPVNVLLDGWKKGRFREVMVGQKGETKCWREEVGEGEIFYVKKHCLFILRQILYPSHRITAYAWSPGKWTGSLLC